MTRRGFSIFLIIAAICFGLKHDVAAARPAHPSISLVETSHVLPRRGHTLLHIKSTSVGKLDITITHVGEGDVLYFLRELSQPSPINASEEGEIVWHGIVDIGASASDAAGTEKITPLNVLQNLGSLKTGLYFISVRDGDPNTTGTPMTQWFAITNLGLEAFSGKDGITAQVRLLSTLGPAPGVDVALIARNNREIARGHTDNQGFVHFEGAVTGGKGMEAPAALYAYGADGEFTPLALKPYQAPFSSPKAWLEVSQSAYKPLDTVRGFCLLRDAAGNAVSANGLQARVERDDGGIAAAQNLTDAGSGTYNFALPMPSLSGTWTLRLYDANETILAAQALNSATPQTHPQVKESEKPATAEIIISPGRRSFQPDAPADIFVQPPYDADLTFAIATDSVTATLDQHIGKEGVALQVPMPDTASGAYVIASALAFADPQGNAILHKTDSAWLEADKGDKRLGVKIDAPETAASGATLSIGVSLTNADNQPAFVSLVGIPVDGPGLPDPLAYFLGQTPLGIAVSDSYTDLAADIVPPEPPAASPPLGIAPLAWTTPVALDAEGKATLPIIMPTGISRLRLYVLSWSAGRLGLGSSDLTLTGKAITAPKAKIATPQWRQQTIAPGATAKIRADKIYISPTPIFAPPLSIDQAGKANFVAVDDPAINALIETTLTPLGTQATLETTYLLERLSAQGAAIPEKTLTLMLDKTEALAANPQIPKAQTAFAQAILIAAGRGGSSADDAAVAASHMLAQSETSRERILALLLLNDARQPISKAQLKGVAALYPEINQQDPLTALALKFAAGIMPADASSYKIGLGGKDATANGFLGVDIPAKAKPLAIENPGPNPIYILQQ